MTQTLDAELLARYLAGEVTEPERAQVRAFLETHLAHTELAAQLRVLSETPGAEHDSVDVDRAVTAFFATIASRTAETDGARRDEVPVRGEGMGRGVPEDAWPSRFGRPSRPMGIRTLWAWDGSRRIGAMAIVAITALIVGHVATTRRNAGTTQTYASALGETTVVQLVDGTRVTMAPRTTMRLVHFGAGTRTVLLDGEAFFDVSQSSNAPFMVQTGTVVTRVLGTAFLVRHYSADRHVRVAVAAGKVAVASQASSRPTVLLTAGHVAEVTDSTALVNTVENIGGEVQWASDELAFHRTPVSDVLATLTRWYGYEFRVADSALMRQSVTIWLSTRSSAKALSTLRNLLNVNVTVTGDTVTLTPRHTRPTMTKQRLESYEAFAPSREAGR